MILSHGVRKARAKASIALAFAYALSVNLARAEAPYERLPAAAKTYAENVRNSCKDYNPDGVPADKMAGITPIKLSDGTPALILDNESLCSDHYSGANCSNRGCDVVILIPGDGAAKVWREIFHEHLYEKSFRFDRGKKLASIVASVYAGDPHCKAPVAPKLMSRDSCNVEIRYENKAWSWR